MVNRNGEFRDLRQGQNITQAPNGADSIFGSYFNKMRDAESAVESELQASVRMQSCWRGYSTRTRLQVLRSSVLNIQRVFRGFLGRHRYAAALIEKQRQDRVNFFNASATSIQKTFRGYYSRKNIHDFYVRKEFLNTINVQNQTIREELKQHYDTQLGEEEARNREEAEKDFGSTISTLHHLVSTKATPGIYNSPYAQGNMPSVFGVPVEEHLRASVVPVALET